MLRARPRLRSQVRFVCDEGVDANVAARLRQLKHQAWTIPAAGLHGVGDDDVTVYACNHNAVVLTHDKEFSQRRRRNVIGRHIQLRCLEWEAADLLAEYLDELLPILRRSDVFISLSAHGFELSRRWD
jgi:predicted nuclease of predicted toxin-antitoxin system